MFLFLIAGAHKSVIENIMDAVVAIPIKSKKKLSNDTRQVVYSYLGLIEWIKVSSLNK